MTPQVGTSMHGDNSGLEAQSDSRLTGSGQRAHGRGTDHRGIPLDLRSNGSESKDGDSVYSVRSGVSVDVKSGLPPRLDQLRSKVWKGESVRDFSEDTQRLLSSRASLMEVKGEYSTIAVLPEPRNPNEPPPLQATALQMQHAWFPHGVWPAVCSRLRLRGLLWFLSLLWPYMLLGFLLSLIAWRSSDDASHPNLQNIHSIVGAILSFTIVFRTTAAYNRFYEARSFMGALCYHLREMVMEAYTALGKDPQDGGCLTDDKEFQMLPQEIRRRVNVLFAFVRQQLRESQEGFMPGTELVNVTFGDSTFYMDPVRPRLWDLLSEEEVVKYMSIPVFARANVVASEIKVMMQVHTAKLRVEPFSYLLHSTNALKGIHDASQAMVRIRDTPVPFPYIYILNVTTFIFAYATPFVYSNNPLCVFAGTQLLIFAYYSILQIGVQLENPFGYDSFDIPIEDFARQLHDETLALATALGRDTKTFVPEHLDEISPIDPTVQHHA